MNDSMADIYSLGIIMYCLLNNNRVPFMPPASQQIRYSDRANAGKLLFSGQKMPAPCNAEGKLAEIVLKACAYNPEERYQSATEMKEALRSLLLCD